MAGMAPIAALLIDLDGTLVDSEPVHLDAHRYFLGSKGIVPTVDDIHGNIGQGDRQFYAALAARHGVEIDVEAWVRAKSEVLLTSYRTDGLPRRPGVDDVLAHAWHAGICCCVVTSSERDIATEALRAAGLEDRLRLRVCYEDTERHKPDPSPYLLAARRLGLPSHHCLAIEDSISGVRAARAAGAQVAGFAGLIPADELRKAGAHHIVSHLAELLPVITRSGGV
jgi:HAD superfamily hydrolase (TIGR01509 family)